jgi:hypothetical protein
LWILQSVLAAYFCLSGVGKSLVPREKLIVKYPVLEDFSANTIRFIGVMELLGAIGVVLPGATGIAAVLTPTAALGLAVMMVLAAVVHLRRSEAVGVAMTVVLCVLAVVICWGRFGPYSF